MKKIIIKKLKDKFSVNLGNEKVVIVTAFSFLGFRLDLWGIGKMEIPINNKEDEVYFNNKILK